MSPQKEYLRLAGTRTTHEQGSLPKQCFWYRFGKAPLFALPVLAEASWSCVILPPQPCALCLWHCPSWPFSPCASLWKPLFLVPTIWCAPSLPRALRLTGAMSGAAFSTRSSSFPPLRRLSPWPWQPWSCSSSKEGIFPSPAGSWQPSCPSCWLA